MEAATASAGVVSAEGEPSTAAWVSASADLLVEAEGYGVEAVQAMWMDWDEGLKRQVLEVIHHALPEPFARLQEMLWNTPDGYLFCDSADWGDRFGERGRQEKSVP